MGLRMWGVGLERESMAPGDEENKRSSLARDRADESQDPGDWMEIIAEE